MEASRLNLNLFVCSLVCLFTIRAAEQNSATQLNSTLMPLLLPPIHVDAAAAAASATHVDYDDQSTTTSRSTASRNHRIKLPACLPARPPSLPDSQMD